MGAGQFFVARVGSGHPFMVWVLISKISTKNVKFFNFFPSDQKISLRVGSESTRVVAGSASYLLWVKSKLEFGRVRSCQIRSGQGPSQVGTSRGQCGLMLMVLGWGSEGHWFKSQQEP